MFGSESRREPQKIGFFLAPNFSMLAFTSSIEPLRAANRISGRNLYQWKTLSLEGGSIQASNGVVIKPDSALTSAIDIDVLFVCAGINAAEITDRRILGRLRDYARADIALGAVCTGSLLLARAGLLNDFRCTIHWEDVEAFVETFPHLEITATLFEIDRNRYTCSGGTAPLDMMIYSISRDHGRKLAIDVAEQLIHNFVREPHDPQRMPIKHRTGINQPKLLAAIAHMEAYIETPLPISDIAGAVDISPRQLERLFRGELRKTPTRYYLETRLQRAKLLLAQTTMPILQVAVATGFTSAAHFSKCYKALFGHTPSAERLSANPLAPTASTTSA